MLRGTKNHPQCTRGLENFPSVVNSKIVLQHRLNFLIQMADITCRRKDRTPSGRDFTPACLGSAWFVSEYTERIPGTVTRIRPQINRFSFGMEMALRMLFLERCMIGQSASVNCGREADDQG